MHGIWHQYAYDTVVADIAEKRAEESCWILVGVYIPASKEREREKKLHNKRDHLEHSSLESLLDKIHALPFPTLLIQDFFTY